MDGVLFRPFFTAFLTLCLIWQLGCIGCGIRTAWFTKIKKGSEALHLKLLLPSHLDERFLDKVGSFLADNENDILRKAVDFKILRESEEFEAVYIKGVQAQEESTTIEVADIAEDKSALEQVSKTREKLKQVQAENAVVTNTDKSSGEELSVSINIGENKTAVAKGIS